MTLCPISQRGRIFRAWKAVANVLNVRYSVPRSQSRTGHPAHRAMRVKSLAPKGFWGIVQR